MNRKATVLNREKATLTMLLLTLERTSCQSEKEGKNEELREERRKVIAVGERAQRDQKEGATQRERMP